MSKPVVVAITGGSGAVYGARLLQVLLASNIDVHLVISPAGHQVIQQELGFSVRPASVQPTVAEALPLADLTLDRQSDRDEQIRHAATRAARDGRLTVHGYQDYFTPIASGSFLTRAMVVCPCSGGTLSSIVRSNSGNLIERAAEVHLKERRKLIIVNRETPLSTFQIENMLRASQAGVVVLPAMPGWYHGVQNLADLVDFIVARILDQLDVPHSLMQRWQDPSDSEPL